jgi:hypothetical protein
VDVLDPSPDGRQLDEEAFLQAVGACARVALFTMREPLAEALVNTEAGLVSLRRHRVMLFFSQEALSEVFSVVGSSGKRLFPGHVVLTTMLGTNYFTV